jgi:hypothetical protein
MTESLPFRADVHAVFVGPDLVILDVAADRYACVADAAAGLSLSPGRDRLEAVEAVFLQPLLEAGVLRAECEFAAPRPPLPALPGRSAISADFPLPRARDLRAATVALLDLARHYRGRSFGQILAAAARARMTRPPITPELCAAVARFHSWSPYAPVSGKCLLRSFMLLRTLRREGLDALWVFGVRTWPFHAHCWLQCEDLVLDDHAERVGAYAPILAL